MSEIEMSREICPKAATRHVGSPLKSAPSLSEAAGNVVISLDLEKYFEHKNIKSNIKLMLPVRFLLNDRSSWTSGTSHSRASPDINLTNIRACVVSQFGPQHQNFAKPAMDQQWSHENMQKFQSVESVDGNGGYQLEQSLFLQLLS